MTKCEIIDLTLSDSDSDGDFIQAKKAKVEPKPPSPRRGHCVQGETLVLRSSNTKMKLMSTAENTCFNRRCVCKSSVQVPPQPCYILHQIFLLRIIECNCMISLVCNFCRHFCTYRIHFCIMFLYI